MGKHTGSKLKSLDIQFYLFYWIHGKPDLYDDGMTQEVKECTPSGQYCHRTSTLEDSLIVWVDIDRIVEREYTEDLHEYLVANMDLPLSHWAELPSETEAVLGEWFAALSA